MNVIMILQKIVMCGFNLMISTFTNDLLINAKQVNYFEMFLLSFVVEVKNMTLSTNFSFIDLMDFDKLNVLKMSLKQINLLNP